MNTYCKARWAEQWPPSSQQQQQHQIMQGNTQIDEQSVVDSVVCSQQQQQHQMQQLAMATDTEIANSRHQQSTANQLIALDHQQLQQELSLQHLQLFNQLQVNILFVDTLLIVVCFCLLSYY